MPYALALAVYFYAGWCMAETAIAEFRRSPKEKVFVYGILLLGWPLFMPWIPRQVRRSRQNKRQKEHKS